MNKEVSNTMQAYLYIPPIIGWKEEELANDMENIEALSKLACESIFTEKARLILYDQVSRLGSTRGPADEKHNRNTGWSATTS